MLQALPIAVGNSLYVRAILFGAGYFAAAELGHLLSFAWREELFATFWPPAGLYLAVLTLTIPRHWWLFISAAWLANVFSDTVVHDKSFLVSTGYWFAKSCSAVIGAALLRRNSGERFHLATLDDLMRLIFASICCGSTLGAVIGGAVIYIAFDTSVWLTVWVTWWLSDALGVVVLAPLIFAWAEDPFGFFRGATYLRVIEAITAFVFLTVTMELVFGNWFPRAVSAPFWILPFILWIAVRLDLRGTSLAVVVIALIGIWHVTHGRGPYVDGNASIRDHVLRSQASLGVSGLSALMLAALIAERQRAEREKNALVEELQNALGAIKTLRGMIPMCAWCRKVRDEKQDWHCVEDFISHNTEARMTHGICPVCYAKQIEELHKQST